MTFAYICWCVQK